MTVDAIKEAIVHLSSPERNHLAEWFGELQEDEWDRKMAVAREAAVPIQPPTSPVRRHISEVIRERMSKVPAEIMAAMPKDGASQHDHYLYGSLKREE